MALPMYVEMCDTLEEVFKHVKEGHQLLRRVPIAGPEGDKPIAPLEVVAAKKDFAVVRHFNGGKRPAEEGIELIHPYGSDYGYVIEREASTVEPIDFAEDLTKRV